MHFCLEWTAKIRFVAVYYPHAGYDIEELENVYLNWRELRWKLSIKVFAVLLEGILIRCLELAEEGSVWRSLRMLMVWILVITLIDLKMSKSGYSRAVWVSEGRLILL